MSLIWYALVAGLGGLLAGMALQYLIGRGTRYRLEREIALKESRIQTEQAREEERAAAQQRAEDTLSATFGKLAHESLEKNSETFLRLAKQNLGGQQELAREELSKREQAVQHLVKPIQDALDKTHRQIVEIEKTRHEAFGGITTQLAAINVSQETLRAETNKLVNALSNPQVRGQWGEITLRRLAELAGMVEHCDFSEQVHVATDEGAIRPDMVIHMPDRGELVVDVKTPLDAYLQAVDASDEVTRKAALQRHARNVLERVRELSAKSYWSQFEHSPEFVILFIPGDQFLTAALNEKPDLLEEALRQKVMLITPTSLVALLKVIAYGWLQLALSDNAEQIRGLAEDLHDRLASFTGHLARVGKQLDASVAAYNQAVGSLEGRVLPGARKFSELGVRPRKALDSPTAVEASARPIKSLTGGEPVVLDDGSTAEAEADEPAPDPPASRH